MFAAHEFIVSCIPLTRMQMQTGTLLYALIRDTRTSKSRSTEASTPTNLLFKFPAMHRSSDPRARVLSCVVGATVPSGRGGSLMFIPSPTTRTHHGPRGTGEFTMWENIASLKVMRNWIYDCSDGSVYIAFQCSRSLCARTVKCGTRATNFENTNITLLAEGTRRWAGNSTGCTLTSNPSYRSGTRRAKLNALHLGAQNNAHNRVERLG